MSAQSFQLLKPKNPWTHGLKTIGFVLFLGFGIRTAAAQCYLIPSGSMKPTIQVNDRLFVDKISYHLINPQRGEIVVFIPPQEVVKQENSQDPYVKRVIGLPGEKVEVKNGQVYIDNQPLPENYIADKPEYTWGPEIVPLNSYLVLGDNRNYSYDSHVWGFVERDRIIGRAVIRFWPPQRIASLPREN
jgi:signal peptidase I